MSRHLEGKVAIVTGSGQGIGRAIAKHLASEGAKVITNNRKPVKPGELHILSPEKFERLTPELKEWVRKEEDQFAGDAETTAAAIREAGGEATACFADITNWDDAKRLVDTAVETYGSVDIVVNVAGAFGFCAVEDMPKELWDRVVTTKPTGYFYVLRHAIPYMIKNKWGRIVNCSSGAFLGSTIRQSEYGAANAGVIGFTRSIAYELRDYNITANIFCPAARTRAAIDMEVFDQALASGEKSSTLTGEVFMHFDDTPLPDGFCPFISYLCTDAAKDVTGTTFFTIDGMVGRYSDPEFCAMIRKESRDQQWTVDYFIETAPEKLFDGYVCAPDKAKQRRS